MNLPTPMRSLVERLTPRQRQYAMLGAILLSVHNLHFLLDLMRRAREAVLADAYEEFFEQWMESDAAADY